MLFLDKYWTLPLLQEERTSEFGLLLANLKSLEDMGKVKIIKHEAFLDFEATVTSFIISQDLDNNIIIHLFGYKAYNNDYDEKDNKIF